MFDLSNGFVVQTDWGTVVFGNGGVSATTGNGGYPVITGTTGAGLGTTGMNPQTAQILTIGAVLVGLYLILH
jgi:hypothetical protein